MTDLVSPLTPEAVRYAWRQLVRRAGVVEALVTDMGLSGSTLRVHYGTPDEIQAGGPTICVVPCADESWQALLTRSGGTLPWANGDGLMIVGVSSPLSGPLPVLFWGAGYEGGNQPFVEQRPDGVIVFYADILAATFFMLSRWEETVVPARDEHQRFPATASVAYKHGFLTRPIVDEYALILREVLAKLLPDWRPQPRRFSVRLTHDIDDARRFSGIYRACRTVAKGVLGRRKPSEVRQALAKSSSVPDPHAGIYELAQISEQCGFRSAFYWMAAEHSPQDRGYDPGSPAVRKCIEDLRSRGHEMGFHAGYGTLVNPDRLAQEKARLDRILGAPASGGRQHYLRFRAPHTWRDWQAAGFTYDSTMGFAEHEGFRCGTCHPFQPFDVEQNVELSLVEIPLIIMDGMLRLYRGLTPQQGEKRILELAESCQRVNGVLTILWHNTCLQDDWEPWGAMYRRVLPRLREMEGSTLAGG